VRVLWLSRGVTRRSTDGVLCQMSPLVGEMQKIDSWFDWDGLRRWHEGQWLKRIDGLKQLRIYRRMRAQKMKRD